MKEEGEKTDEIPKLQELYMKYFFKYMYWLYENLHYFKLAAWVNNLKNSKRAIFHGNLGLSMKSVTLKQIQS